MNNYKPRSSLMGVVAAYLLYTAFELYQGRNNPDTTMTPAVMILFIVLFVIAAGALIVYAYRLWKRGTQEEKEKAREDDPDSMK